MVVTHCWDHIPSYSGEEVALFGCFWGLFVCKILDFLFVLTYISYDDKLLGLWCLALSKIIFVFIPIENVLQMSYPPIF